MRLVSPWVDKHDILLNFDPTFDNNTGRFIVSSDKTLSFLDPRIPATLAHGYRRTVRARYWPRSDPNR